MDKASTVKELSEDIWRLVILAFIQVSFSSYVSKSQNFFYIYIFILQITAPLYSF